MIKNISLGAALALFVVLGNYNNAQASTSITETATEQSKPEQEDPKSKKKKKKSKKGTSCCSEGAKKSCSEKKTETK